jgi:hypothetical protein
MNARFDFSLRPDSDLMPEIAFCSGNVAAAYR